MKAGALGNADLHIHTSASDGMAGAEELLDYVEGTSDLDVIAVTDHDNIKGAHAAREAWAKKRYRFDFIAGIEVTALEGHLLALFVEEPIRPFRRIEETLEEVHRQDGLCIVPHPMSWLTRSLGQKTIERITFKALDGAYFDGIETANQTLAARITIEKAKKLNELRYHLAPVGCSDAHFLQAVGSAYTVFAGKTAAELRQGILAAETAGRNARRPTLREIGAGQIIRQTWRGLTVTPRTLGLGATAWSFTKRIFPFLP